MNLHPLFHLTDTQVVMICAAPGLVWVAYAVVYWVRRGVIEWKENRGTFRRY